MYFHVFPCVFHVFHLFHVFHVGESMGEFISGNVGEFWALLRWYRRMAPVM